MVAGSTPRGASALAPPTSCAHHDLLVWSVWPAAATTSAVVIASVDNRNGNFEACCSGSCGKAGRHSWPLACEFLVCTQIMYPAAAPASTCLLSRRPTRGRAVWLFSRRSPRPHRKAVFSRLSLVVEHWLAGCCMMVATCEHSVDESP